ncbi:MAG: type II toxin-antitoxin system Phd/YefM family antitoxin [Planctomycetes bacterium]|nr:type II toxin-antitoxin system Phd/YefM family antitoxin [Planctomycetota bacterium]MBM4078217.1 type II toxin-antitoxin system Phd/YefM family antitoxin [Planctomycetota bacterium]MBM4084191.1 type II toxin-antitoxin system Phd/YefM family antitoxin [Planctomycetota bacterium]
MKFLSVQDLRRRSSDVWRDLPREKEMVVMDNGRPVAILTSVSESGFEGSLRAIRQARAIQAVADLQRESVAKGTDKTTLDEINVEIRAVRRKRSP